MTIHAAALAPEGTESVREIDGFWSRTAYRVGPHVLTLDDIEHGVRATLHPNSRVSLGLGLGVNHKT